MKKTFTLFLILVSQTIFAQNPSDYYSYAIDFEDTTQFYRINIDTISNPNNIWQIGPPQKTVLASAYSDPNVIITDTLNPYPVSDTSQFVITHIAGAGYVWPHTVYLGGKYKVNCDSSDFGRIEISPDNGATWVNLLTDTFYLNQYCYEWYSSIPTLSGTSDGWVDFGVGMAGFGPVFNIQFGDTVLYRFTFISDSIQTNKDGLMFDNLEFYDVAEGIEEIGYTSIKSECHPNPVIDELTISFENEQNALFDLFIFDVSGKEIYHSMNSSGKLNLSVGHFQKGIYFFKLIESTDKKYTVGKFVKE